MAALLQLADQLLDVKPNGLQGTLPLRGRAIEPATRAAEFELTHAKIAAVRQTMQHGIQRAGTDEVSMSFKLFEHSQPEDLLFCRVIKHVQLDQTGQQILVGHFKEYNPTFSKSVIVRIHPGNQRGRHMLKVTSSVGRSEELKFP